MSWQITGAHQPHAAEPWVADSKTCLLLKAAPGVAWDEIQLKLHFVASGRGVTLEIDPWIIHLDEAANRLTLSKYVGGNLFQAWDISALADGWNTLEGICSNSGIEIGLNGTIFCYAGVAQRTTYIQLHCPPGTQFHEPEVHLRTVADPVPPPSPKQLEFTVDFFDDLQVAPFDINGLDTMFHTMASVGASHANWIHHGPQGVGFWESSSAQDNIQRSFEALGEDYLAAAVRAAHRAGMTLFGVFKPFDTTILHYTDPVSPGQSANALGGNLKHAFTFPADHPTLCLRRRVTSRTSQRISSITLRSRHELPVDAGPIHIWCSDDNATYTPYSEKPGQQINGREIVITELNISARFLVLEFPPEIAHQLQNVLAELATVRDESGVPAAFTYALAARYDRKPGFHLNRKLELLDFRTHGMNFDCAGSGVPTAVWNAGSVALELFSPANSHGLLGITLGQNSQVPGVLSESEPVAREWWLQMVRAMLTAGVDGVEIRVQNHANVLSWPDAGFNPPLIQEYERRYGHAIDSEAFVHEAFRRLRGEFFTTFLHEASRITREAGKKFRLHFEDLHQGPPNESCPMDLYLPWREWLDEGLCDGVSIKALNLWAHDTAFGRDVIAACRKAGIPVNFTPFINSAFTHPQRDALLDSYLDSAIDAFNVYEFATLWKFNPDGTAVETDPALTNWLRSHNWRTNWLMAL